MAKENLKEARGASQSEANELEMVKASGKASNQQSY